MKMTSKTLSVLGVSAALLFTVGAASADTVTNAWSGVAGDRGNMSAFAFKGDAGAYPDSVTPPGTLTPTFDLNSLSLYRPAIGSGDLPSIGTGFMQLPDTNTPVFMDIYTTMTGSGASTSFSGYQGSSSSSVTWADVATQAQNTPFTFNFSGITLDRSTKYWFVFSTDNVDGNWADFRVALNTSGSDGTAGQGQGYLVGDTVQSLTSGPNPATRDWAFAYSADFTPVGVPEPSTMVLAALGGAGMLLMLRRRNAM